MQIGSYDIIGKLGQGGMGETFLATHQLLKRKTVIKRILGRIDEESLGRFVQEGQAGGSIHHPNVVAIYDLAKDDIFGPYLAMEFVEGKSLEQPENKTRLNNLLAVLDIANQIAQALIHIHSLKIVHRDLKPSNVFVTEEKDPQSRLLIKVGDFGLARMPGGAASQFTERGYLLGTPEYAPPEQFDDTSSVDERADLYALGVMLYEMLTGDLPPNYKRAVDQFRKHESQAERWLHTIKKRETPPTPSSLRPEWQIPPQLDELVLRLLKPDPADRYQSATELFRDLSEIRQALTQLQSPFDAAGQSTNQTNSARASTKQRTATIQPGSMLALPGFGPKVLPKGRHLDAADLMLARNPSRVRQIFTALGYATYEGEITAVADMGFTQADVENIVSMHWLADYNELQMFLFELNDLSTLAVRRLAQNLLKRGGNYFFVAVQPSGSLSGEKLYPQLVMVCPQRVGSALAANPLVKLHRLVIDTARPTRHALDVLEALALPKPDLNAGEIYKKLLAAFDVEKVTSRFYLRYAKLYRDVVKKVKETNQGIAAFNDPMELKGFVQRLFGRMMFLYFLQKKGWLDHDANFLTTQFRLYDGKRANYYGQLLMPLFFRTLACRENEGRNTDPEAGPVWSEEQVPYLNGGLFELAAGQEYEPEVFLDNLLFAPDVDGGILEFFNSYDFTVEEDTPLEAEVALDPEMLGKVFENLLEEDERGQSGTFYTPRSIVHFITRRALAGYLSEQLKDRRIELSRDELMPHFDAAYDDPLVQPLSNQAAKVIEQSLANLRALDPAVGSGAFPVGLLQDMVAMRKAVARARRVQVESGSGEIARWKREYISHCLYGVDIKPAAIEIAKLRLWLSLVVDLDRSQLEPLPNLDYKMMAGNSLLETINGRPILLGSGNGQAVMEFGERAMVQAEFEQLRDRFFEFDGTPEEKHALRDKLLELEKRLVLLSLEEQKQNLNDREGRMLKQHNWETLQKTAKGKKELTEINAGLEAIAEAEKQIKQEGRRPFFLFQLHFSDVFRSKGGFDLVIGNPPYVRGTQVNKDTKAQLAEAYSKLYDGDADLYVYFYGRGFGLLREGGRLAYITSNKFFRADYGKPLRNFFSDNIKLETVIDFGELPVFEAAADPCIVVGVKPAIDSKLDAKSIGVEILTVKSIEILSELERYVVSNATSRFQSDLSVDQGWNLGEVSALKLLAKIKASGQQFEKIIDGRFYRGVTTGYNQAFIIDAVTRNRLINEDAKSAEIIKPYVRGRDIKQYKFKSANLYLIFTRRGINIEIYPAIKNFLIQFYEDLKPRTSDTEKRGRKSGPYKWYEIQDSTAYYQEFEKPKIVYPDISISSKFAYDSAQIFADATLFIVPTEDFWLLALLNSKLAWHFFKSICAVLGDVDKGGRLRLKSIYVGQLPVAMPTAEQRTKVEGLVEKLVEHGPDVPEAAGWQAEIDRIVYEIYGLTEEEIALIEGQGHAEEQEQMSGEIEPIE